MSGNFYDFEESRLKEEIAERGAKKVLIQLPEGLKTESLKLVSAIEETGATAIISGDPCYGACDIPLHDAELLGIDLIIHYGHTKMTNNEGIKIPLVYFEAKVEVEIRTAVRKALNKLQLWNNIGLFTTVQHIHKLKDAKKVLVEAGKNVFMGEGRHTKYSGQVLGCDYSGPKSISKMVEAFLFVGGGRFHAIGLYLSTMKPTLVADPFENISYSIDEEAQKIIRKRWAKIDKAKTAHVFGVIIGMKPGQNNIGASMRIKKDLYRNGKKAVLLALHEINPEALQNFTRIDAFVNTACPRIALDDSSYFDKPVLNLKEAYVMLDKTSWEELLKNGLL